MFLTSGASRQRVCRRAQYAGSNKLIPRLDQADSPHGALTDKAAGHNVQNGLRAHSECTVVLSRNSRTVKFYVTCDLNYQ